MLQIELNGTPHQVADPHSLQDLIAGLSMSNQALAVAVNRQVVPRQSWAQHLLRAGDRVDVVKAIGGG